MDAREWPAGRDLDVEIGRQVFGHTVYETEAQYTKTGPYRLHSLDAVTHQDLPQYLVSENRGTRSVPPYSTDISAAWLVVDQMYLYWTVAVIRCESTQGMWECVLGGWLRARAVTAPLAICRAALAAGGTVRFASDDDVSTNLAEKGE